MTIKKSSHNCNSKDYLHIITKNSQKLVVTYIKEILFIVIGVWKYLEDDIAWFRNQQLNCKKVDQYEILVL